MAAIVVALLQLATLVLIARAILSWFPIGFDSPVRPLADFLHRITEPVVGPVRRVLPPFGGLDISSLLVLVVIQFVLIPLARNLP